VHRVAFAEVGVAGEGFLVSWPAGFEPALRAVVVAIGVLGGDAVEGPGGWGLVCRLLFWKDGGRKGGGTIRRRG
jgi:hypothetical protein